MTANIHNIIATPLTDAGNATTVPSEATPTPTPQVDEAPQVVATPVEEKTSKEKRKPPQRQTYKDLLDAEAKEKARAHKEAQKKEALANRPKLARCSPKLYMDPEVSETLRRISQVSGLSQNHLFLIAISHLIKVYAPYYGLAEWSAPRVILPPLAVSTKVAQAQQVQQAQMDAQLSQAQMRHEPPEPQPYLHEPHPYQQPYQRPYQHPYPSAPSYPYGIPSQYPERGAPVEHSQVDGIPMEVVTFRP